MSNYPPIASLRSFEALQSLANLQRVQPPFFIDLYATPLADKEFYPNKLLEEDVGTYVVNTTFIWLSLAIAAANEISREISSYLIAASGQLDGERSGTGRD
jgi:hypothetical protein